ncbi:MAG: sigma-70 family RNA polymerase sigma factor [Aureliella sp.]
MDATERFVTELTENQAKVYGYVFSLVGDHARAADIVQETNLVLWRKREEFESGRPFLPWATGIARFQVLAHLRDKGRDKMLLDADLAEQLSAESSRQVEQYDSLQAALAKCLQQLPDASRNLIHRRYTEAASIARIAEHSKKTESAVKVALMRIRNKLGDCVERRLAMEGEQ